MSGTPQNQPLEPLPFRPRPPVVIGILGGIAAGKSAVATAFAAHGVRHIDADGIARQVSARPEVVQAVARDLGPDVVGADGRLDRQRLAVMIFSDPAARARLEALTHPPVRAAILLDLAKARSEATSVLLDVPPGVGLGRAGDANRMEAEPEAFHAEVRAAFLRRATASPERYLVLHADRPKAEVAAAVLAAVLERLGR